MHIQRQTAHIKWVILFILISISLSSCYTYSLVADKDADSVIHHRETRWAALWGIVKSKDIDAKCDQGAISNVTVDNTFFHDLVTIGL